MKNKNEPLAEKEIALCMDGALGWEFWCPQGM